MKTKNILEELKYKIPSYYRDPVVIVNDNTTITIYQRSDNFEFYNSGRTVCYDSPKNISQINFDVRLT